MENRENGEKYGVLKKNSLLLFDITKAATLIIEQEIGVTFAELCSNLQRNNLYKARIIFAGIMDKYGVPTGVIAQLIYKTKDSIEGYIAHFIAKTKTSIEFQQIIEKIEIILTT